jgi:hypothetical protein
MAVVVSRQPLDWYALNNAISRTPARTMRPAQRRARRQAGPQRPFQKLRQRQYAVHRTGRNDNSVVATIVEISKK